MKRIITIKGRTLEELKIIFKCHHCGCEYEAEYGDYYGDVIETERFFSYCPNCGRQVIKFVNKKGMGEI